MAKRDMSIMISVKVDKQKSKEVITYIIVK